LTSRSRVKNHRDEMEGRGEKKNWKAEKRRIDEEGDVSQVRKVFPVGARLGQGEEASVAKEVAQESRNGAAMPGSGLRIPRRRGSDPSGGYEPAGQNWNAIYGENAANPSKPDRNGRSRGPPALTG